ncbi:MAG: anhydro-N-acetylmuramic acid kinase [Flavobacteriaceae bacterium]|nr:anhydro-N-acetylmuramic acid kinase [Flavobacteriaceae bacterium]
MEDKVYHVIGLMSGTSLDGVDLVCVSFLSENNYEFKIEYAKTYSYSVDWKEKLKQSFNATAEEITYLHVVSGRYLGQLINHFIDEFSIKNIDFIASHGHTIFHNPSKKYTLQIGHGASISAITKLKVVCDFRSQDVALGGQGAPLVPIGDLILFSDYDYCLNLGGFANISYQENGLRKAFDICPVNVVLNYYAEKLGFPFDENGKLSSQGYIIQDLLKELNQLPFYINSSPKSLGVEFVMSEILPIINKYSISEKDILRTFVEHIAIKIAEKVNPSKKILVTGGGTYNLFLINRIRELSKSIIVIPSDLLINYKEALIFALLGVLRVEGKINCLKSVTGAIKDHSSGIIYMP